MNTIRILTIDDDLIVLATIKNIIDRVIDENKMNIEAHFCSTKKSGLDLFEKSLKTTEEYDLVFLDLSIDEMEDGFELIPVFKTHSPKINVVIITGSAHIGTLQRAKEAGADGYVKKPVVVLTNRITDIIQRTYKLRELEREFIKIAYDNENV